VGPPRSPLPSFPRLRRIALLGTLLYVGLLELSRYLLYPYFHSVLGHVLMDAVVVTGALFFFGALFQVIGNLQRQLERQNEELLALYHAGLGIHGELALDVVLQAVVDQARQLLGARYGALSVIDEQGHIKSFLTSGVSAAERARIGDPPQGHGLLAIPLLEGQRLRLPDLTRHPRSVGFPAHHPEMHSLLAVPVPCKGGFRGNLYLAEKQGAAEFAASDEETLARFATKAAIAIDNAQLHERLRALAVAEERVRIAHEMHDGLAQVLAYVNTKAQAVKEFLRAGKQEQAAAQLDELAAAAREVYGDVREGIVGLRSAHSGDRTLVESLQAYLADWQDRSGIRAELVTDPGLVVPPTVEVQIARIVQEALANIRKHARARSARIEMRAAGSGLVLAIEDDGIGFNPALVRPSEFPRFGLATMRERAEGIGGSLEIDTAPGKGTRLHVALPYGSMAEAVR
jgi:signal transduction histidine kinase